MISCNANYIAPIKSLKTDFNNKLKKSDTNYNEKNTESLLNKEKSYVSSDLAISFLGIDNIKNKKTKPLTMEELSQYKNSMGVERFEDKEKKDLIFLSGVCPAIINLIKLETTLGKPRFNFKDINYLADIHEVHPESITALAQIETSEHEPRFEASDIDELLITYEFMPEETTALAKMETQYGEPRFTNYDIMNLTDAYNHYPEEVKELAKIKTGKGFPKFKGYEISALAKMYKKHKTAINELVEIKTSDGYDRFNGEDIEDLAESYEQHAKTIKELASIEWGNTVFPFLGEDIRILIPTYEKYPNSVKDLAEIRTSNNSFRFGVFAISDLAELYEKYPDVINSLARAETDKGRAKFSTNEIKQIADLCNNEDLKQVITENTDKIKSCRKNSSDNFIELEIDDKILHVKVDLNEGYKILGEETQRNKIDSKTTELKMADGSVKSESYSKKWTKEWQGYLETIKDKDGHVVSRTLTKPSNKNKGVLVVLKEILGKNEDLLEVKQLSTVKNYGEKDDKRVIRREFVSPNGVINKQTIMETPHIKSSKYEIKDKIFQRRFRKVDKNTTETVAWGNAYKVKFNDDIEITVTKKDGTVENAKLDKNQIDPKLLPLIKKLPGDYLYTISKTKTNVAVTYANNLRDNACFYHNEILISPELANDTATFAHEFGHLLDEVVLNNLHKDEDLKKIYKKELDSYKNQSTGLNEEQIMYFIAKKHENKGGCLTEIIAETNLILSGLLHNQNKTLLRAKILQENFPETMLYIGNKIQQGMENV